MKLTMAILASLLTVLGLRTAAQTPTFSDNLRTFDSKKWRVATWKSANNIPGLNEGVYVPETIDFSQGMLRIAVTQQYAPGSNSLVFSKGGCIWTYEKFGYGTYEFVMRESTTSPTPYGPGKTLTGAVSSAYIYLKNSESEMDLEFLGDKNHIFMSTWHNTNPQNPPVFSTSKVTDEVTSKNRLGDDFHTYAIVWTPKSVVYLIDGRQVAKHTSHIPSAPAYIILQHRGTNSNLWGGRATVGVMRYTYIKSASFTPLGAQ